MPPITSKATAAESARVRAVERYRLLDSAHDQVLSRVVRLAAEFCSAPMAVVSIVGRDRIRFVASHGFDVDLPTVSRNDGLFGSAVLSDAPHVVRDVRADPGTRDNSLVTEHRIGCYAGAPIVTSDGHRLGAVAVLDNDPCTATDAQLATLTDLAAIVAEQLDLRVSARTALRAERQLRGVAEDDRDEARRDRDDAQSDRDEAVRDRNIAEHDRDLIAQYATVLQRTLLPPSLPYIDGLTVASHYHPASSRQVGGDFYDVFAVGSNRWAFFIGDVEGHGAEAAVVTSLIRYTLRSAALHYDNPIDVLVELNSVLLREVEPRRFCTVLFGILEPRSDGPGFGVTIATGGHQPALLADAASGTVEQIRPSHGMLVGLIPGASFDACSLRLLPGQTLICYTDGIVESRRAEITFDEDRLAAFVTERTTLGAAALIDDLVALIPKLSPDDDIALLALGIAR